MEKKDIQKPIKTEYTEDILNKNLCTENTKFEKIKDFIKDYKNKAESN